MQGKRRRKPAPPTIAGHVAESPETAANAGAGRTTGLRYDADELFPNSPRLSECQRRALELAADAKSDEVIASMMGNSPRTVENHLAKVREKLDAGDRIEAIVFYHQAIEARQDKTITGLIARVRALEQQLTALRRELRRRS